MYLLFIFNTFSKGLLNETGKTECHIVSAYVNITGFFKKKKTENDLMVIGTWPLLGKY